LATGIRASKIAAFKPCTTHLRLGLLDMVVEQLNAHNLLKVTTCLVELELVRIDYLRKK
jgi:hypothetical protein